MEICVTDSVFDPSWVPQFFSKMASVNWSQEAYPAIQSSVLMVGTLASLADPLSSFSGVEMMISYLEKLSKKKRTKIP